MDAVWNYIPQERIKVILTFTQELFLILRLGPKNLIHHIADPDNKMKGEDYKDY